MGAAAGLVVATLAAVVWAAISYLTHYQISWMALGVGAAVGATVRALSRSGGRLQAITSAALALFGCLLGNLLTAIAYATFHNGLSLPTILLSLLLDPGLIVKVMVDTFEPLDLLFYAVATFTGYRAAAR
jgi:hypothetical protein